MGDGQVNADSRGDEAARLRDLSARLRVAATGSAVLDRLVEVALSGATEAGAAGAVASACWTGNLSDALTLLPPDCNFSTGRRDGICWSWIQPNDGWQPGAHESRHDHPGGSGLVVARTEALSLTAAIISLRAVRLAPHMASPQTAAASAERP